MKAYLLIALCLAVLPGTARMTGTEGLPQQAASRDAGWRADLDTLLAVARRVHASPQRPAHSADFAQAAAELRERVPALPDHRIAVEIQRLLAMLGDGHSLVYPMPSPRVSLGMLPIEVYLFEDGLYIVDGLGPARDLVGSRIRRFGSLATEEVLRRMERYVSRDNPIGLKAFASLYPVIPEYLEAWGATTDRRRVTLTVQDTLGAVREVVLDAGPARRTRRRLHPPPAARDTLPLYLREPERNFWLHALPARRALYVQFNQVADAPGARIADLARLMRDSLAAQRLTSLIIDVRHNNGGNNLLLGPLLDEIASFAGVSRAHRVHVLTSRSTFSAAQNFINRLERRVPGATFAGEPSMSSPNFTGEDNPVRLPYSGLVVSISNRYWQDSDPGDRRPWIAPHLAVAMTGRDWLRNRDPVLERVLQEIGR